MSRNAKSIRNYLESTIESICSDPVRYVVNPHKDFTRNRSWSMKSIITLCLQMEGKSLPSELLEYSQYARDTPSVSSFIQARDKIKIDAFIDLFSQFKPIIRKPKLYKGFQLLAHDGSDINIPHNPEFPEAVNKSGKNPCSLLHLNALFDVQNKQYVAADYQYKKKSDERYSLCDMVNSMAFDSPVIFMGDRGYEAFYVYETIRKAGHHFLIRVKDIESNGFLNNVALPESNTFDTTIKFKLTRGQTKEVKSNPVYHSLSKSSRFPFLPEGSKEHYEMELRVVRLELEDGNYECLITNLDPFQFKKQNLKELYHLRWGIETSFRELKYPLSLSKLHGKKYEAILKEIYARLILYNYAMALSMAVPLPDKKRKHDYQINFTQAFGICRQYLRNKRIDVEHLIQKHISPIRPGRKDERTLVRKRFQGYGYRVA